MNRQVVQYSALGCVAVAALGGIIYFAFLGGTKADDGPSATAKSEADSEAPPSRASTSRPDPLFAAPVQIGKTDRQPVSDPFQRRTSQVVQTAYGDVEPRRFEPDPTASPLMPASDRSHRASAAGNRLVAGGANAADEQDVTTSAQPPDPFGLRMRGTNASATENAAPKKTSSAANKNNKSATNKKGSHLPNGAGSRYGDSGARNDAGLHLIEPAPLDGAISSDSADSSAAAESTSVFDRPRTKSAKGSTTSSKNKSAAKDVSTNRNSQSKNAAAPSLAQPHTQFGPAADNADEHDAADSEEPFQGRQPLTSRNGATDGLRQFDNDGVGPIGAGGNQLRPELSAGAFPARDPETSKLLNQQPRANAFSIPPGGPGGSGRPGSRQVEGKQSPQITIHKIAPDELQVGKAAKVELHVRNTGTVVAQNVEVRDVVPENMQFVAANPPADPNVQGELIWPIGALKPGDETTIEIELMPIAEGEVGSVAVVTFQAEAGARSRVTKPDLTLQVTSVKQVMIGQEVMLSIKIANPGSGIATGVVIEERVHPD